MSSRDVHDRLPVRVTAEILDGKPDPSAEARFANGSRAGDYAQTLADSGDYAVVKVHDDQAAAVYVIEPQA